jgi:hypothetical protein
MVTVPADRTPEEAADEVVSLIEEGGAEKRFRLHDAFEVDGVNYYLVEAEDDPEVVLLLREANGALETVEPDEFDRVMAILESENEQ